MSQLTGWDGLRHSGLLLDARQQQVIAEQISPEPLPDAVERELGKTLVSVLDKDEGAIRAFIPLVLGKVCSLDSAGTWLRGSLVPSEYGIKTPLNEVVKPDHIWTGSKGGEIPVFINYKKSLKSGAGRRDTSNALYWLRGSKHNLAVLTDGRLWRLVFAGLDFSAYCEWDSELWFEGGKPSQYVTLLRKMLHPTAWTPPTVDESPPLLQAILDSRKGQADLSMIMGEKIRQAVELLVQEHAPLLRRDCGEIENSYIYNAAVRVIMRLVIILFAESRDLLPRELSIYQDSYSIGGLSDMLRNAAHKNETSLRMSYSAWPRIISLFKLIYSGSHHESLPIFEYGGDLFAPFDKQPNEVSGLATALQVFETGCFDGDNVMPDLAVHNILELITRTKLRLKQNRSHTYVSAPVDFSDLSSDYIGVLYEGLLDFELHVAQDNDPIIFLGIDIEPAISLGSLENMDDKSIKDLFKALKPKSGDDDEEEANIPQATTDDEDNSVLRDRAEKWAIRAMRVAKLLPAGKHDEENIKKLVKRIVLPGEYYLVRWGGTRKGSGTFYTPLGLVAPTVHRTLDPMVRSVNSGAESASETDEERKESELAKPEELLAIRVVDPACGSGAFLVAATRFLTNVLYDSLHVHDRIDPNRDRKLVYILGLSPNCDRNGESSTEENLPCPPDDHNFETQLKAILRRYVVERCIYGVDINPLAVELCKLALWIETMDKSLSFSFLDHKIKCGNALIGSWFDEFQHYPLMAWKNRESGDEKHSNGHHYSKGELSKKIKAFSKETVLPDMLRLLDDFPLFPMKDDINNTHNKLKKLHNHIEKIHSQSLREPARQAESFRQDVIDSPAYKSIKSRMDLWCSCWFWSINDIEQAPLPTSLLGPTDEMIETAAQLAAKHKFFHWELEFPEVFNGEHPGFHAVVGNPPWDVPAPKSLEFFAIIDPLYRLYDKQVGMRKQSEYFGADSSVEKGWIDYIGWFRFFSNYVTHAHNPFGDPKLADKPAFKFSLGSGRKSAGLHDKWRKLRANSYGYMSDKHPYRHQGKAGSNLYKLFLERAQYLLKEKGRLGMIVPSGIHSDAGTGALRKLLLDTCNWEWLFSFINSEKIFPSVDSRCKADVVIAEKGKETTEVNCAFERSRVEDWAKGENYAIRYGRDQVSRFSPNFGVFLEFHGANDIEYLEKAYSSCVLFDDPEQWRIRYVREFDSTGDSKYFHRIDKLENESFRVDEYSRWIKGNWQHIEDLDLPAGPSGIEKSNSFISPPYAGMPCTRTSLPEGLIISRDNKYWIDENDIDKLALPLYKGSMIGQFDFSAKAYLSGSGKSSVWEPIPWSCCTGKHLRPLFSMDAGDCEKQYISKNILQNDSLKIGMRSIGGSTNARSMISASIINSPCMHTISTLTPENQLLTPLLPIFLNSFAYDYFLRIRLVGTSISKFIIDETLLPRIESLPMESLQTLALSVSMCNERYSYRWLEFENYSTSWRKLWAITPHERERKIAICNAISFALYGHDYDSARHIMQGCDLPTGDIQPELNKLKLPSGFWRVDQDKEPELRQTILALMAFKSLLDTIHQSRGDRIEGIKQFLDKNNGEGWMLPEVVRLSDYKLGHDSRAKEEQPVSSEFGPRFCKWQLEQDVADSWKECRLHARNFLGKEGFEKAQNNTVGSMTDVASETQDDPDEIRYSEGPLFSEN